MYVFCFFSAQQHYSWNDKIAGDYPSGFPVSVISGDNFILCPDCWFKFTFKLIFLVGIWPSYLENVLTQVVCTFFLLKLHDYQMLRMLSILHFCLATCSNVISGSACDKSDYFFRYVEYFCVENKSIQNKNRAVIFYRTSIISEVHPIGRPFYRVSRNPSIRSRLFYRSFKMNKNGGWDD